MNIKSHILQLAKYGFFGVIATLVHLFSAWAIIYFFAASVFVSNTLAFFTAFIFSYIFQTLYVFSTSFHFKKFIKFFLVQYGTFLFSYLLSDIFPIQNGYLHTLLIVAIMPLITFVIHKFWTFK
ncbi:GtrA family protein [Sulfurimonas autotrophica]|uniref:GtrA family protein n=1 Tax=Sulfurimonas autotrophica (strain ATCC BAA-671 / DSM 16294 / JCM 11897 / OK10) TaxID=563040 RepID=E0UV19_SULAO|nr:GtrA family protein [Sulfurimonas autotrophica]ADN09601.1 GtrA family protein [Sulfurimonas autotrophica DSM 16294]